jgi:hypothetical protein
MNVGVSRDGHVTRDGVAEVELRFPAQVLVLRVDPEQQLFLGGLGDLAVGRLVARVGLEVLGDIVGHVRQQRRPEEQAHVRRLRHAGLGSERPHRAHRLLDHAEVRTLGAAHVRVPLVLREVGEDRVLRVGHLAFLARRRASMQASGYVRVS